MKAVIQRVLHASVAVDGQVVGQIDQGLLVLLGIAAGDTEAQLTRLLAKLLPLRIFTDEAGKMNLSVADVQGGILVVSQFTLLADCRKGNRPSYTAAAPPAEANRLYELALAQLRAAYTAGPVAAGIFGADMKVTLLNDGPVTIVLDTDTL